VLLRIEAAREVDPGGRAAAPDPRTRLRGLTQLKLFVNPLKDVEAPDPVVRFETAPGKPM